MKKKVFIALIIFMAFLSGLQAQRLTQEFNHDRIFVTPLVGIASGISTDAARDQTTGPYRADTWESVQIHTGDTVTQGIPGASCYYSICKTIRDTGKDKNKYWQSLQVQCHQSLGCRNRVVRYRVNNTINVAIAKVLANNTFGAGGAWQFFIPKAAQTNLTAIDTITLIP